MRIIIVVGPDQGGSRRSPVEKLAEELSLSGCKVTVAGLAIPSSFSGSGVNTATFEGLLEQTPRISGEVGADVIHATVWDQESSAFVSSYRETINPAVRVILDMSGKTLDFERVHGAAILPTFLEIDALLVGTNPLIAGQFYKIPAFSYSKRIRTDALSSTPLLAIYADVLATKKQATLPPDSDGRLRNTGNSPHPAFSQNRLVHELEYRYRNAELRRTLAEMHWRRLDRQIRAVEKIARDREARNADENVRLSKRINELDAELTARDSRLRAIINSTAWKLAAPLRDLEKIFRKFSGAVRTSPATSQNDSLGARREPTNPAVPRKYCYNFDFPGTLRSAIGPINIRGWCYEADGAAILGIRASFGGKIFAGSYGLKRLDVLASAGRPNAEYSGFKLDVQAPIGRHVLAVEALHNDGWSEYFRTEVVVEPPGEQWFLDDYEKWCMEQETLTDHDQGAIGAHIASLRLQPLISVIMPVFNPPEGALKKAIESVLSQVYPRWQLCIADDASTDPEAIEMLEQYGSRDARIHITRRTVNGHISEASNSALAVARGEFVALLDHDDTLAPTALYEVAVAINANPNAQFIYSDEDKVSQNDRRYDPYFKPDWNPDLFHGQNFTCHLSTYSTSLVKRLGGFRVGFEGSQDWDLALRIIEQIPPSSIVHIPKILYHWRAVPGSTAIETDEKSYATVSAKRALEEHLGRLGIDASLVAVPGNHWRVRYTLPNREPFVSLIIPTRNGLELLKRAIESIQTVTNYLNFEILIVDNGSDEPETLNYLAGLQNSSDSKIRVIRHDGPFNFSAINNQAVQVARGEVIAFLNNDIEALSSDWLREMVSHALRPGIGAVGAMLYYPTNTIQHAGVILGLGGVAGHAFKDFPRGDAGQMNRLRLVQNYSAVTGACLVIRKDRFLEVGGFNEVQLPIAFNDIDLCCKLLEAGYRNVWTPFSEFYHHESASRGIEDTSEKRARFDREIDYMMRTWSERLLEDPSYNPNLSLVSEDFSLAYVSRSHRSWEAFLP